VATRCVPADHRAPPLSSSIVQSLNQYLFPEVSHDISAGRTAYLHLISGKLNVNGEDLNTGDALKISNEHELHIHGYVQAEFLLFDLPY
jgi:redox-sensitive bicupin YhaK (pirin superfamily)